MKLLSNIVKSPVTSVSGGIAAVVGLGAVLLYQFGYVTEDQAMTIALIGSTIATTVGLLMARDADRSSQDHDVRPK